MFVQYDSDDDAPDDEKFFTLALNCNGCFGSTSKYDYNGPPGELPQCIVPSNDNKNEKYIPTIATNASNDKIMTASQKIHNNESIHKNTNDNKVEIVNKNPTIELDAQDKKPEHDGENQLSQSNNNNINDNTIISLKKINEKEQIIEDTTSQSSSPPPKTKSATATTKITNNKPQNNYFLKIFCENNELLDTTEDICQRMNDYISMCSNSFSDNSNNFYNMLKEDDDDDDTIMLLPLSHYEDNTAIEVDIDEFYSFGKNFFR